MEHTIVIPSKLEHIENARIFLGEIFQFYHLEITSFNMVFLGLSEAITNSILHGNRCDDSKQVTIKVYYFNGELTIEIEDEGDGFQTGNICDPIVKENRKRENGRGIFLITSFAKEVLYQEGGKKVIIKYAVKDEH